MEKFQKQDELQFICSSRAFDELYIEKKVTKEAYEEAVNHHNTENHPELKNARSANYIAFN
jgi:hypothetical protein